MAGIDLFHQVEGENAILRSNGVFKQADIFIRAGEYYVKHGSGYVRLLVDGKTSAPKLFWDQLSITPKVGQLGRLVK